MRKILIAAFGLLIFQCPIFAETIIVTVKNFQFSPAVVNAVVGDVIQWNWQNGAHTTTSTSIPEAAAPWDEPIDLNNPSFSYTLNAPGTYEYKCTPHFPEMVGTINVTGTVPVKLTSFTVAPAKLNAALLSWTTSKEENTSYFAIKRSGDGRNFTEIGRINAVGNSTLIQRYSFTDNNLATAEPYLYYYLDIVDKDGKRQNSQIITFKNAATTAKLIKSLTPNPVSPPGHLMLQFYADKAGAMNAKVYTSDGKLALEKNLSADPGLNNGHIHLGNLKPGVYNIVFTMDGKRENYRIVMQ